MQGIISPNFYLNITKYKNKHNRDADAMNTDGVEQSKEHRLNLITKIIELESNIKDFESREEEAFLKIKKNLLNYIN